MTNRNDWSQIVSVTLVSLLVIGAIAGWFMNILALWNQSESLGKVVLRIIGIFMAPLGAFLGWL